MSEPSSHVNIDGDVIAYAVGFAAEQKMWAVEDKVFEDKADAEGFADRNGLEPPEPHIFPEPLDHCLSSVKRMIDNVVEASKATTYTVLLTGDDNFRDDIATLQPYKGNRSGHKPFHYADIIAYLVNVKGAEVIDGEEADDQLSIRAVRDGHTIATIDKDLDNTPGWHYNWKRDELYEVGDVEASRNFYKQLLTGDSVDNIPGLYRLTGTKAKKAFKDDIDKASDVAAMYQIVHDCYLNAMVANEDYTLDDLCEDDVNALWEDVYDITTEIGRLLWMRREEGELWTPPLKTTK